MCLTPRGRAALRAMQAGNRALEAEWEDRIGAERMADLRRTIIDLLDGR